ncbi:MAG: 50S ribosomal protein L4 [Spirochaetales bacterium]|jgi:large subunit ribosomal protein L4|nr:50S ribosomal protein L4 [Spirochaetales bacterium]
MDKKVYSIEGKELRTVTLDDAVFAREVSEGSIYLAINNELANRRVGTACTQTRRQVTGSTAKPWKQKGTGRARSGDKKSPVWVGGGTAFGPKPRDYSFSMPKKAKRLAMKSILSLKAKTDLITVVEDFTIESGKTKDFVKVISNFVDKERTVVILKNDDAMVRRAGRNVPNVKFLAYDKLKAHELFYGKKIVVLEGAVEKLNEFYGK